MRTWPALEVHVGPDAELLQAALVDYEVAAIDDNAPETWRVFFHTSDERERARRGLPPAFAPSPIDVPDEDWAARSQANLHAIHVGRVVVAPPWDVVIRIQPSMGFGTGHHATTRLCLAALQQIDLRGRSAIDVGTGSGVLAIAASLLGASPVVAIDDDPDAIQSARENVAMNAAAIVDVRLADLRAVGDARGPAAAAFDVVLANLTGGLLIQAAGRLQDLTAASGRLILSGFLRHEEAAVLAAFEGLRLRGGRESFKEDSGRDSPPLSSLNDSRPPLNRAEEDEWVCVTLERSASSSPSR
jgi:ribosomal protein L11 methyltransferase